MSGVKGCKKSKGLIETFLSPRFISSFFNPHLINTVSSGELFVNFLMKVIFGHYFSGSRFPAPDINGIVCDFLAVMNFILNSIYFQNLPLYKFYLTQAKKHHLEQEQTMPEATYLRCSISPITIFNGDFHDLQI